MKEILNINDLSKTYHTKKCEIEALKNINFKIYEGDFIGIVGPSGCGKSTLLSILGNLEDITKGNIEKKEDLKIGYMLQDDCLFPWLTIYENCLLGLKINKKLTKENIENVKNLLETYGLKDFINNYPKDLSGGMRQRVALIRTLALKPDLLLLDEPFSALDYQTRLSVSFDVLNIIKKEKKTLIIVTHDISEAISMCSKIIVLSKRPSTIKKIYNIDYQMDTNNPIKSRSSKEFMNYYEKIWEDLNEE
jgi:NitT/TauT family transport system ATP-binding protein